MKVVWINPRFLHYRVPVYYELNKLLDDQLKVIFSDTRVPEDVKVSIENALGNNAIALQGEKLSTLRTRKHDFSNVGFNIPFQPGLLKAITAAKPDVIIAEGFFQWTPAAFWLRITRGIPLVVAYERTKHTERNAGVLRTSYRKIIAKYANAICCNGILSKEYCTEVLGFPENHIITGAMAADTDTIMRSFKNVDDSILQSLKKKFNLTSPIFLYVGRLIQPKGLRELLIAWKKYNEISSTIGTLLLVGDGSDRNILEQMVNELKLMNVVFVGNIEYNKIVPYFTVSDVFVMPTLEDNWSLVVPEAMACCKPILCSKYNGCWPELVHEDVNGHVFDPYDANSLAMLLKKCTDNCKQLPLMGSASFEIVQDYTPKKAAESILKCCQIALDYQRSR